VKQIFTIFIIFTFIAIALEFKIDSNKSRTSRAKSFSKLKADLTLANFYLKNKNIVKAKTIYQQVVKKKPVNYILEEAKFMLAEVNYLELNKKEAIKQFKLYLREFPFGEYTYNAHTRLEALNR
jgi:outer membrane protein assembly factor BamD (BamD/ComL family)